jgi:hypothetical protein
MDVKHIISELMHAQTQIKQTQAVLSVSNWGRGAVSYDLGRFGKATPIS